MVNLDQANVNVLMWPEHDGRSMQEHVVASSSACFGDRVNMFTLPF